MRRGASRNSWERVYPGTETYPSSLRPNLRLGGPGIHGQTGRARSNTGSDTCVQYLLPDQDHTIWPSFHLWREQSSIRQTSGCFSRIVSVMQKRATPYHWRRDLQLLSISIETSFLRTFCVTSQKRMRTKI